MQVHLIPLRLSNGWLSKKLPHTNSISEFFEDLQENNGSSNKWITIILIVLVIVLFLIMIKQEKKKDTDNTYQQY